MAKNGLHLITPTSIAYTGTSASISANGSVTFSAVSTLSLNGVFSADYDNYMVVIKTTSSGTTAKLLRLRASGTDATGTDYTNQFLQANNTTVSGTRTTSATSARGCAVYATQNTGDVINIYGPYLAQPTAFRNVSVSDNGSAMIQDYANTHSLSSSYDGLTLTVTANDLTGLVSVYGMRK